MLTLQKYPQISRSLADQELLDRPYINKHTGLDFLVMCFMGSVLGLLSIPYCAWNRMVWSDGMVHHGAPGGELQDELKKHVETS